MATASLELGIDIGPVELVCQVGSPRSIATFLQRVAGPTTAATACPGPAVPPHPRRAGRVRRPAGRRAAGRARDAPFTPDGPLDILAQQLVAEVAAVGEEGWRLDELYDLVRRAHPYRNLTREAFDEVVAMVSQG